VGLKEWKPCKLITCCIIYCDELKGDICYQLMEKRADEQSQPVEQVREFMRDCQCQCQCP